MNHKKILLFIFLLYAIARVAANLPALQKPRELADTQAYLRISTMPLHSEKFWGDARPLVFPLLLKISSQDVAAASGIQLAISILAWGLLAWAIGAAFSSRRLSLFSFVVILLLSLARPLASWDYVMMTESLSVTFFVLFLAMGIFYSLAHFKLKDFPLILTAVLLAFTRDTNAYLLLMLAGMLTIAVIFRWANRRVMIFVFSFLLIFFLNDYTSNLGGRWVFPLNNNIGKRVLTDASALQYFESCGMPVNAELLALADSFANGQDRAFYESPALESYRAWLYADGKSCYMKYLLTHPVQNILDTFLQFDSLIRFENLNKFFARSYDPVIPYYIEPLIYPAYLILPLWGLLTFVALFSLWKQWWNQNSLWAIYILLCLPIFPHLFITWHGDAMAPERHALSVGLQLALCFWLAIFLLLEKLSFKFSNRTQSN